MCGSMHPHKQAVMCDPRVASRHPPDSPDFGIVMPLYASHFHHARNFVWTHCALVEDARPVPIGFVLSSEGELAYWNRLLLSTLETWRKASGGTCQLDWRLAHSCCKSQKPVSCLF